MGPRAGWRVWRGTSTSKLQLLAGRESSEETNTIGFPIGFMHSQAEIQKRSAKTGGVIADRNGAITPPLSFQAQKSRISASRGGVIAKILVVWSTARCAVLKATETSAAGAF